MDSYVKILIDHMAKREKVKITDQHLKILNYAYAYYEQRKVGPLYSSIQKNTDISQTEVDRLFPKGLNSIYTWIGIPVQSAQNPCKPAVVLQVEHPREVYLDYSATTPIRDEVKTSLLNFNDATYFGNPGSSHKLGKSAYNIIYHARRTVAQCLDVAPETIVFTSGGTESNNLALKGIAFNHLINGSPKRHIISSKTEHPSVLSTLFFLESIGFKITYLDVNREGIIHPELVKNSITPQTLLVCVMAVNNEIGNLNSITEIGQITQKLNIPFVVDAVQAFGKIPLKPTEMGVDVMSMTAHKIYGPKGVGALYIRPGLNLTPLLHGGEQENHLRAGTENVANIHAFSVAAKLSHEKMEGENTRLKHLHDYFLNELNRVEKNFICIGNFNKKIPQIINIGFQGIDSGSLLLSLNNIGVYVSSGSACSAGKNEASHVIKAMGINTDKYGTVRFSLGMNTIKEDIDYLICYLPKILVKLRSL